MKIIIAILMLFISTIVYVQPYKSGYLKYKEYIENDKDSSFYNKDSMLYNQHKRITEVYFDSTRLSIISTDYNGKKRRSLYNYDLMMYYSFEDLPIDSNFIKEHEFNNFEIEQYLKTKKIFTKHPINSVLNYKVGSNFFLDNYIDRYIFLNNIDSCLHNFKFKKYKKIDTYFDKEEILTTTEVYFPHFKYLWPKASSFKDSVLIIKHKKTSNGIDLIFELFNFEPELKSYFAFDTTTNNYITSDKRYEIDKDLNKTLNKNKINIVGTNSDKVSKLIKLGYLDQPFLINKNDTLFENYDDFYLVSRVCKKFESDDKDSLLSVIYGANLFTKSELLSYNLVNLSDIEEIKTALILASIKKLIDNPETRKYITHQIDSFRYVFRDKNAKSNFINNDISFGKFLESISVVTTLTEVDTVYNFDTFVSIINFIIRRTLPTLTNLKILINRNKQDILIQNQNEMYSIKYRDFFETDYENYSIDSSGNEVYLNKNYIEINNNFYDKIISVARQINADANTGYYFTIDRFSENIHNLELDESIYKKIKNQIPKLKIFNNDYFLVLYPREKFDYLKTLNFSFPYDDKFTNWQMRMTSLISGNGECMIDYVTTSQKRNFIKFIKNYKKKFNLIDAEIEEIETSMETELISSPYELFNRLNNKVIRTSVFGNNYPNFENGDSFKVVFPSLFRVLGEEFNAVNLRTNPTSQYMIEMDLNGSTISIKQNEDRFESLINGINGYLKKSKKMFRKYKANSDFSYSYILLSDQEVSELNYIFNLDLFNL